MTEQGSERRSRRGGGRDARRTLRGNASAVITPFLVRHIPPVDMLTDEAAEAIEDAAETVLEEIGIDFRDDPEALEILRGVGCDIQG